MINTRSELERFLRSEINRLEKEVEEAIMFGIFGTGAGVIALCVAVMIAMKQYA